MEEQKVTKTKEKCSECGKELEHEPYAFDLPNGKRICADCLYVKHGYDREPNE